MSRYKAYALIDPRDSYVFYIGHSLNSPDVILQEHLNNKSELRSINNRVSDIQKSTNKILGIVMLQGIDSI